MKKQLQLALLLNIFVTTLFAQTRKPCPVPTVLHITKVGPDLYYQVDDAKPHKLYTLGEVSSAVRNCSTERSLFVVAAPEVPVGSIHVPGKEQLERVRYFIQYSTNSVEELGRDLWYNKLPITPDVIPEPSQDESPLDDHFIMPGAREHGIVPDEATAIAIAKAVLSSSAVRGNVRDQEPWHATLQGDRWLVSGRWHPDKLMFGGGGLSIFINKQNGEVSYLAYSK